MKSSVKKLIIAGSVLLAFIVWLIIAANRPAPDNHKKYAGANLEDDIETTMREGTYDGYLNAHKDASRPQTDVVIDVTKYSSDSVGVSVKNNYNGYGKALFTDTESDVTWSFDVKEAGFYNINIIYYAEESRGVPVERRLLINGELPFSNAESFTFLRMWQDKGEPKIDNQGNEIRPTQIEYFDWQDVFFTDSMGYVTEPYMFYFSKGQNTITLQGVNEPMTIGSLKLTEVKDLISYSEYKQANASKSPASTDAGLKYYNKVEGETSVRRSESSLYAKYDKSAANTSPYALDHTVLNYVGGDAWKTAGQWIEWDIEVPEDGFYNIAIKGRQNYARGAVSCRSLLIDNQIPFDEVSAIEFYYNNEWDLMLLGESEDEPFEFYLTKGTHTIRLSATLGNMGTILGALEDSTYRLNTIYRRILVYTSSQPDANRDYHVEVMFPDEFAALDLEYKRLYKIVDDTVAFTGQKAEQIASAQNIARQIERFMKKPNKLTKEFGAFKDNITAIGTSMLTLSEIKLDVDYLVVKGTDAKLEKDTTNFFKNAWHEIKAFVVSFFVDYNALGDLYGEDDDVIKVWVVTGRDQGVILKSMIDDTYTMETGNKVNLEIVAADAVLQAVLAGRGPDVLLSVNPDQPINYALRGAAEDITQFPDYEEVLSEFHPESYIQYEFQGGIYGVPETQTFGVMFYRKDILEELGLEPPQTWTELIAMLPTIQGKSMQVGLPSAAGSSGSALAVGTSSDLTLYFTLLYQNGGECYNELGSKATVDSEECIKAFEDYSRYFTDYGIPTVFDFASRFRSGEMPIGIFPFSMYNTFMVSAPEIRGLWDFTLIPGTEKVDENGNTYIDRSSFVSAMATMMIKNPKNTEAHKQKAWEFVKWWASADTQVRYGREIEALLGASSRYNTANRVAFKQLAWSAEDIKILDQQWNDIRGIREVPGGYYTGRHITNAIRKVINEKTDPRETMIDYVIEINEEITKKRKEFNLPLE